MARDPVAAGFDARLRERLYAELDALRVRTPAPHEARYGRLVTVRPVRRRRLVPALVTGVFAFGVLLGLSLGSRSLNPLDWGREATMMASRCSHELASANLRGCVLGPTDLALEPELRELDVLSPPATQEPESASTPVQQAPAPPAAALFEDDFERARLGPNPPPGWTVASGSWDGVVQDGSRIVRHSSGRPFGHLAAGSPSWTDYAVAVDVRPTWLASGYAGVAGRFQGPGDYYLCGIFSGNNLQLWRLRGGTGRSLAATRHMTIEPTRFHTVRLEMRGNQLACSLDGSQVIRATDTTFAGGRVALVASKDAAAGFDNVRVTSQG